MGHDNIPISEFIAWIEGSFDMPVPALSDAFLSAQLDDETTTSDAARWEKLIFCQIADLRQMQADGIFENELAFFGVTANRASTAGFREECLPMWFNLDPCSFVECGLQGAFHGWTPESVSERGLVPGNVAVSDAATGEIVVVPADEIESDPVPMDGLTWQDMIGFQESGQYYE